ncbi:glycosyltransferase family 4 protein [Halococcus hamelinensis]|uniref:Glycosyl transferase, group 1 family protein n=2 Tax=Halococcus hamelinensis TaxID=332168 RepID=M0LTU8_9EURY|nr:glycosyltransferase family 4 protein [Halococcus hamelinensis]EMA36876.1 glycosyl transferase, group 1 family protein [Halococcus hamelinensis 100A6]
MDVLVCLTDSRTGGPQIRSLSVARLLRERGIETSFLFPPGEDVFAERLAEEGFSVYRPHFSCVHPPARVFANLNYVGTFPVSVARILGCIRDLDPDLVHVNMSFNFQSAVAAYLSDAKVLWHLNDVNAPWPINRAVATAAKAMSDTIVVSSNVVNQHFFVEDWEGSETVYPIVDTDQYDPLKTFVDKNPLHEMVDIDASTPIVGSIGNVNRTKGYEYLLRAVRHVVDSYGPICVPIAGSILDTQREYYRSLLKLRSELKLEDTVHFLGRRSDIPQLLSEFDAFAMPSVAETGPMTLMEAMAMEKPIVTTNVGVVPEQFVHKEHGLVVPPADSESLGEAMCDLLNEPKKCREYGRSARERAKDAFSVDHIADRHIEVYSSTLEP